MTSTDIQHPGHDMAGPDADYDLHSNIGYLLRRAHQLGSAAFQHADDTGLSVIQFATLASLVRSGPDSQNSLGRSVGSDAATTKGIVERLYRRGFVETHDDPTDRRMKTIAITDEGRAVYRRAVRASRESSEEILAPFSPGERTMLVEMLQRIVAADDPHLGHKP
ncbi:MarR family winged helix-turn-helix transcriptional regulator [Georgenia sp. SYP-B2076]|uniref:MarR family winged helix-turn-helix transcriptional regulator n=1 Tax=Georgenia sp. SYP-B2076 TaxID=2495881 RepID=UPI000F8F1513|nr:MarR family winged helix-turn-helix transcriptional regulator [Georgenia sp. SYP-B2076]